MAEVRPAVLLREAGGAASIALTSDSVLLILSVVGPAVRRARLRRQRSLSAVAREVGMGQPMLSRIETGQRVPRLDQLVALCAVVGVRLSDVLRLAEDEVFPLGGGPWTDEPESLLAGADRLLSRRPRRGGDA